MWSAHPNGVGGQRRAVELKQRLIVVGGPLPEISSGEQTF
jgi:hypothetical protein